MIFAVDLGTSNTTVYVKGVGVVLSEPTMAVVQCGKKMEIRLTGNAAKKMIGKTTGNSVLYSPVEDGIVVKPDVASLMLKDYFGRIVNGSMIKHRIRAVVSVNCGASLAERKVLENVFRGAGVNDVVIVDSPLALKQVVPENNAFFVDIGGGTTEISAVSKIGIIHAYSLNIGGNTIDDAIINLLSERFMLKIGKVTAEKIKHSIGSLYENDISTVTVSGRNVISGAPVSIELNAADVRPLIKSYIDKILEVVAAVINLVPPEMAGDMASKGIYIAGGCSHLAGLSEYVASALKLNVEVMDSNSLITGLSLLAADRTRLNEALNMENL